MWQLHKARTPAAVRGVLNLESLEDRFHLSGNVVAELVGGTLTLSGDDGNSSVQVSTFEDATNGVGFRVEGYDKGGPTTINGNSVAEFFGVVNLYVDLGAGDDDLAVSNNLSALSECLQLDLNPEVAAFSVYGNLDIPGWATLRMGSGANRVGVGPAAVGERLLIEGGSGEDQVGLCDVAVGTNLVIRTFGGFDQVAIHDSSAVGLAKFAGANGGSEVRVDGLTADDLVVQGGYQEDNVRLECLSIGDDVVVQTLNGVDSVAVQGCRDDFRSEPSLAGPGSFRSEIGDLLAIQTQDGEGFIAVNNVNARRINILGGQNSDYLKISSIRTELNVNINTLAGNDLVGLAEVEALNAFVLTGLGDDNVIVPTGGSCFQIVDDLVIVTDLGNDNVRIGERNVEPEDAVVAEVREVQVGNDLVINTGGDTDRIDVNNFVVGGDAIIDAGAGDDFGDRFDEGLVAEAAPLQIGGGVYLYGLDALGNLNVFLGDGIDSAIIEYSTVGGNAYIDAGLGDDGYDDVKPNFGYDYKYRGVQIDQMEVGGSFWLNLGPGNDIGKVYGLFVADNAYFNGGTQNDSFSLSYINIGQTLYVFMGAGDDALYLTESTAANAWLYGQAGLNDLYYSDSNVFGSEHVYTFEQFVI